MTTRAEQAAYGDEIRRMAAEGLSDRQIGDKLGRTSKAIHSFRKWHGIPAGRPKPETAAHGTPYMYGALRCRCELCKAANSQMCKRWRDEHPQYKAIVNIRARLARDAARPPKPPRPAKPKPPPRVLQPCGTPAAARRHRKHHEPLCPACVAAERAYAKTKPSRQPAARKQAPHRPATPVKVKARLRGDTATRAGIRRAGDLRTWAPYEAGRLTLPAGLYSDSGAR